MSARILNPATTMMMAEVAQVKLKSAVTQNTVSQNNNNSTMQNNNSHNDPPGRVCPSRAALAKVRRDLFGPVDHAAAKALAEQELKNQAMIDSERWGFDFRLGVPLKANSQSSRFEWKAISKQDFVPEPYALRGMPYLRKSSYFDRRNNNSPIKEKLSSPRRLVMVTPAKNRRFFDNSASTGSSSPIIEQETTPPQDNKPNSNSAISLTPEVTPGFAGLSVRSAEKRKDEDRAQSQQQVITTPISSKKQASITDFMKSRKRSITCTTKSLTDPAEKIARSASQIRS